MLNYVWNSIFIPENVQSHKYTQKIRKHKNEEEGKYRVHTYNMAIELNIEYRRSFKFNSRCYYNMVRMLNPIENINFMYILKFSPLFC